MPKYGASREMSQSPRPPSPSSHSFALFATWGCSLPSWVQVRRNSTHAGSESLKKKWSEERSSGFTPESAEYGFFSSIAEYTVLQFSQASPYWSLAPQLGHSPLM